MKSLVKIFSSSLTAFSEGLRTTSVHGYDTGWHEPVFKLNKKILWKKPQKNKQKKKTFLTQHAPSQDREKRPVFHPVHGIAAMNVSRYPYPIHASSWYHCAWILWLKYRIHSCKGSDMVHLVSETYNRAKRNTGKRKKKHPQTPLPW